MPRSFTLTGPVTAGLVALVLLAGCAAPGPAPGSASDADEHTDTEQLVDAPAGETAAGPGGEQSVALPPTYPSDAVPLVSGTVLSAADAGILWNVVVRPDADVLAAADDAEATLTGLGFTLLTRVDDNRAYRSAEYDVNVNVHDDGTLSYTVFPL